MVILSVHNSADTYGASRSLLLMLGPFSAEDHQIHVVVPNNGPLVNLLEAQGAVVYIAPFLAIIERAKIKSFWGRASFFIHYIRSILWLSRLIIRLKVDVVHTNTAVLPAPAIAACLTRRKHVWHIREFFAEFPAIWKFYQKYMSCFSYRIITISNAVQNQFDVPLRAKCTTIFNGLGQDACAVDYAMARRFRASVGAPAFLVGVVGRIKWERKGQEVLIRAAALLSKRFPDVRYVIVGSASPGNEHHLDRLRNLISDKGLEEQVVFAGEIENTRDIYAAFDVTVVPSVLPEPFGRVVMESMAAGTPVIGSRCGGIPEQIVDGSTGLLFNAGDEKDLAVALAKLMEDESTRLRISDAGRKYIIKRFDESVAYSQLSELFSAPPKKIRDSNGSSPSVILSVHNSADIYGASRTLLRMLSPFVRDGHRVHVVLPDKGPLVTMLSEHGITVHFLRSLAVVERTEFNSAVGKLIFPFRYICSVLRLSVLIVRLKANVVHTNTAVLPAPAMAAWLTKRRHLWHIREFFDEFPSLWKYYQQYMGMFSNTIITISESVQKQFGPPSRDRCTTIYDGLGQDASAVDPAAARRFRSSVGDPKFLIGVVGRIKWVRKGQEVLVKAAALLAGEYPDARYVIVGSPSPGNTDHLRRLRELISSKNLDDRFIFTGDINEMRDVYAAFDVTVVPSIFPEPFGCVVTESMAAGTPVIGSRCGGIPEQISDGLTGLLFNPGDENDLARALEQLMKDKGMRLRMGGAGQMRFRRDFNIEGTHRQFNQLFIPHVTPMCITSEKCDHAR